MRELWLRRAGERAVGGPAPADDDGVEDECRAPRQVTKAAGQGGGRGSVGIWAPGTGRTGKAISTHSLLRVCTGVRIYVQRNRRLLPARRIPGTKQLVDELDRALGTNQRYEGSRKAVYRDNPGAQVM